MIIVAVSYYIYIPDQHKSGSDLGISSLFLLSVSSTILIRQWLRPHNRDAACYQVLKQSLLKLYFEVAKSRVGKRFQFFMTDAGQNQLLTPPHTRGVITTALLS